MFEAPDDRPDRIPSVDLPRSPGYWRALYLAVLPLGYLLRGQSREGKEWIAVGLGTLGAMVFGVLEYRAYRERKAGPPSLKS